MQAKPKEDEHGSISFHETRQDKLDGNDAVITVINNKKKGDMSAAPSGPVMVKKEKRSMAAPPSGTMVVKREKRSMAAPPAPVQQQTQKTGNFKVKLEKKSYTGAPQPKAAVSPLKDSPLRPSDLEIKSNPDSNNQVSSPASSTGFGKVASQEKERIVKVNAN